MNETAMSGVTPAATPTSIPAPTPSRGELVRGSSHYRAAREAPRDFGLLSGNVIGAHVLLMTALNIRDRQLGRNPTKRDTGAYVPTDREAMAELVNVTHQELMKVLAEISDNIVEGSFW